MSGRSLFAQIALSQGRGAFFTREMNIARTQGPAVLD